MIQETINNAIDFVDGFRLSKALELLRPIFAAHPKLSDAAEIEDINETFQTMLRYMRQNADDPDRMKLYRQLLRRTYRVAADLDISWRCKNVGFYVTQFQKAARLNMSHDFIRTVLETFVSDVAMLSLDVNAADIKTRKADIFSRHQAFIERLFAAITVSCQWSEGERKFWSSLLVSPTIDSADALVITSAITISAMNQFDINKSECLADIYANATDTPLRERALIGFVLSADDEKTILFTEMGDTAERIASIPGTAHEMLELQKQIFYCLNAEDDTRKIQNEIMPDLTKNAPYRVSGTGMIEERETDHMQDILHPDADDKAMEKIEESMQKIADMQKQGADIYFGGFSHMKRFPFFATAANWFMPYTDEQPDVAKVRDKIGNSHFIDLLISRSAFCESDKYSLTFAVNAIYDRMPPALREMLNSSEAINIDVPQDEAQTPTFIRRQYLQDLYRFFMLHPQRNDLISAFDMDRKAFFMRTDTFSIPQLEKMMPSLAVFLHDQHRYGEMASVLQVFNEKQQDTLTFWLLSGSACSHRYDYEGAVEAYSHALEKDTNNEMALRGKARSAMLSEQFDIAADTYAQLLQLYPGEKSFLVNRALALINNNETDDAVSVVYEADYRYPDDANVWRVKAWLLMKQHKPDEALDEYHKLTADGAKPIAEDYLNMGYALWVTGDIGGAATAFGQFKSMNSSADLYNEFCSDSALLYTYGLNDDDYSLMEELVEA